MYGIKIINVVVEDSVPLKTETILKTLSEHTDVNNASTLQFETEEEAEIYAHNHEFHSYEIVVL